MRQLLRLLLYLAAGYVLYLPCTRSSYFESAPACGYVEQDFVHFERSQEPLEERSLGVCGWGFDSIPKLQPRVDLCASCYFTPVENPSCSSGTVLVRQSEWLLAQQDDCSWQGCFFSGDNCSNGTAESSAVCDDGSVNLRCCPFKRYYRCCSMLSCTLRSSPAGQCVVREMDLLAGQQFVGRVFAVNTASTDCYPYSFETTRICQSDRTFGSSGGLLYDSCDTPPVGRDTDGCAKLPGYSFYKGWLLSGAPSWRVDDGTQWSLLASPADAQLAAATDMPLMASRCTASDACAAFQNTGNSTNMLYQLPSQQYWVKVNDDSDAARCFGIYAKSTPSTSCSRVSGYLFIPHNTLDTSAGTDFTAPSGDVPCSDCSDPTTLAIRCDAYGHNGACAGFSQYHGLLTSASSSTSSLLSDQPFTEFTSTPCVGTFVRAGKAFPAEVEQLDQLLCGEFVYCTGQLRYHASGQSSSSASSSSSGSYYVDLTVDILTDYTTPRGLQDVSGSGLRQLPSVRSLVLHCRNGAVILGGLPLAVVALMPFLQELRVVGCRVTGGLPSELSRLRYLRALDLSANSFTGTLPEAWANMSLGYLNLSSNQLTGTLPKSWRGVLTAAPAALPPPPPVATAAAAAPPPPAAAAAAAALQAQWGLLVADLSANRLEGAVDRKYVYDSCVRKELRMQLHDTPRPALLAALGEGAVPTFLLQYNPGVAEWAGRYQFAVADMGRAMGGSSNLCGAYRYKIALGVLWGVFGLCLLAIVSWASWAAWTSSRASRRSQFIIADLGGGGGSDGGGGDGDGPATAADNGPGGGGEGRSAEAAGCAGAGGVRAALVRLWSKRWVRRVVLLMRVGYLVADVALDIRVIVWLFNDGDRTSAAVCLAFLAATQAAISAALLASLAHHFFASRALVAMLSPVLLLMGPILGPVLAVGNLRSSDVPLVFWRYLELVEFCVALLQAPAESVTQSVVYARQNLMGAGMYLDHPLFLASIILSLGDMLIAAIKLCRYKRGPLRRVLVAITHLDKVRDPFDYRLLNHDGSGGVTLSSTVGGRASPIATHPLETPLNPLPQPSVTAGGRQGAALETSGRGSPGTAVRSGGPGSTAAAVQGAVQAAAQAAVAAAVGSSSSGTNPYTPPDVVQGTDSPSAASTSASAPGTEPSTAVAHTFTPLTAPRYRPSLLAASAQRLGGGGIIGAGGLHPHHSATPITPSRLGPAGGQRHSSVTAPTRPLVASPSLPVTPTAARGAEAARAATSAAASSAAASGQARAWDAAMAAEQQPHASGGEGGSASLSRRSRSMQVATPPPPPPLTAQNPLVGSISSDVYGAAATGGHGPPVVTSSSSKPPAGTTATAAVQSGSGERMSGGASRSSGGGSTSAAAWPPPPPPLFPRSALSHPPTDGTVDPSYLASAAAAAAAALAEDATGGSGADGHGLSAMPGASAPAGLVFSPGRIAPEGGAGAEGAIMSFGSSGLGLGGGSSGTSVASTAGAGTSGGIPAAASNSHSLLRRAPSTAASLRSANVSPARRREGPSLSIAVPVSSVGSQGIEVIRMSTPSSLRQHMSPQTSGGASTPVGWLPPPPQPPQPQSQQQERSGESGAGQKED